MNSTLGMMIIAVALVAAGLIYAKRRGGTGKLGFIGIELSEPLSGKKEAAAE